MTERLYALSDTDVATLAKAIERINDIYARVVNLRVTGARAFHNSPAGIAIDVGQDPTPVRRGAVQFGEVISAATIIEGARWRYHVQLGDFTSEDDLPQTDPEFDACWTLRDEGARFYTVNSIGIHNLSSLLTGGEGADMTVSGAWTKDRRPIGIGAVVPLYWTGTLWMMAVPNNIATGCG